MTGCGSGGACRNSQGRARSMEEAVFPSLPGKDISQRAARHKDLVMASGGQDSFLHSETSEHTIRFVFTHDGPLCALSIEFQILEQQGLTHTVMVVKPLCSHNPIRILRNVYVLAHFNIHNFSSHV